ELLDQQHAHPVGGGALQRRHQALDDDRREAQRELVDEDELRPRDERLREHDHLLLAAGERAGDRVPARLPERGELDRVLDPALASSRESEYVATRMLSSTVRSG